MRAKRMLIVMSTLGLGMLLGAVLTFAQNSDEQLSSMTAQWWQFAGSIPSTVNPGLDTTGGNCVVGQRGAAWFLVGTFSTGPVTRNCSVPAGESLFFPVVNFVNINTPNVCGQGPDNISVADLRAQIAPSIDAATNLSVQVDGKPVNDLPRVKSDVFAISFPADNIFNAPCTGAGLGTVPAGTYSPAVDDGVYVLLEPLKAGTHTLHIHGEIPSQNLVVDVTYNLTIVPVRRK